MWVWKGGSITVASYRMALYMYNTVDMYIAIVLGFALAIPLGRSGFPNKLRLNSHCSVILRVYNRAFFPGFAILIPNYGSWNIKLSGNVKKMLKRALLQSSTRKDMALCFVNIRRVVDISTTHHSRRGAQISYARSF